MFEDEPRRRSGCNSVPYLAWDLNMHPRTRACIIFLAILVNWSMYLKFIFELWTLNAKETQLVYKQAKRTLNKFKFQHGYPVVPCARRRKYKGKRGSDYVSPTRGTRFPIGTTRLL